MALAPAIKVLFPGNLASVQDRGDLRALDSSEYGPLANILVQGGAEFGDGQGGAYTWDPASLAVDNDLTVIRPFDRTPLQRGRWLLVGNLANVGPQGNPGGNVMSIGLFSTASAMTIPAGADLVQTSGHSVRGSGSARYVYDPAIDAAYVTANPLISFRDVTGRGFVLAEKKPTLSMFNPPAVGIGNGGPALLAAIKYASATRAELLIDTSIRLTTFLNIQGINGVRIRSLPTATIQLPDNEYYLLVYLCNDWDVEWNVTGALSSDTQYEKQTFDLKTYFATGVTYESVDENQVVTITDGSDFYHALVGAGYTMGLTTAIGGGGTPVGAGQYIRRRVVSDFIPLGAQSRFFVDVKGGAIGGEGLYPIAYRLYDASNAYLGMYVPENSGDIGYLANGWTHVIQGAAKMKVVLEANRTYKTAPGLVGTYDLAMVDLYKVINDLATQSTAGSPGNQGHIYIRDCNRVRLGGTYSRMQIAALKFMRQGNTGPGCEDCEISDAKFYQVAQGISVDYSRRCSVVRCTFDMRYKTTAGAWMGNRVFRLRCVGGVYSEGTIVRNNVMRGASWAVELITYTADFYHNIDDNIVEAEFCGISSSFNGSVRGSVSRNKVVMSAMGDYGLELAGGGGGLGGENNEATGNDVTFLGHTGRGGFAFAPSRFVKCYISGGKIDAPYGCYATEGVDLLFAPAHLTWSAGILFSSAEKTTLILPASKRLFGFHSQIPNTYQAVYIKPLGGLREGYVRFSSFDGGTGGSITLQGTTTSAIENVSITAMGFAYPSEVEYIPDGQVIKARIHRLVATNSTAGQFVNVTATPVGASRWDIRDNRLNDQYRNTVAGTITPIMISGAADIAGTLPTATPGLMAAGASVLLGTATVQHITVADFVKATPYAANGMPAGFVVVPRITGPATVELYLINLSGASATPAPSAWALLGQKLN